jgi:hypothetical protein
VSTGKVVMVRLRLRNSGERDVEFVLEPWGEIYRMPAGATFEVSAEGPAGPDTLEVEHSPGRITVWGWAESTVALSHEGRELTADSPLAVVAERTSN